MKSILLWSWLGKLFEICVCSMGSSERGGCVHQKSVIWIVAKILGGIENWFYKLGSYERPLTKWI